MSTKEAVKSTKEDINVPIAELIESSTNPRKVFDQSFLEELAESIRNRGILSPLLVRPVNNHLEIVAGAQRFRAAKLAGLEVAPIRLKAMTDLEAQETQQIENVQRKDVHPFEEAQGYRTLLGFEGANYTIEKLAARIGKRPEDVAERLKLLDLTEPVAKAFVAGHIGLRHALLIAKLVTKMPNLVMISQNYDATGDTTTLARRNYIEIVTRKPTKGKGARPEQRLCDHLKPAIHADGMEKGRLVKVCANLDCKVHFGNHQKEEEQRLQFKAEKKAASRKLKQTISCRHPLLADVLKRVKPQFGT